MPNTSLYDNIKRTETKKKKNHFASLFFFYVIPFILINLTIFYIVTALPKASISISEPINYNTVEINIVKHSLFPIKSINAKFENEVLELKKISNNVYSATVNKNGNLEVAIGNLNGMSKTFYDYVGSIDDNPPTIDGLVEGNTVSVNFTDENSGINYDSLYAMDTKGKKISPKNIDKVNNTADFRYDGSSLEVHLTDNAGNEVTATFTDRVE